MSDSNKIKNKNDRGGKREGSGRPVGSGKYKEPTKAIRVPEGSVSYIKEYLNTEYRNKEHRNKEQTDKKQAEQKTSNSNVVLLGKSNEESISSEFPLFSSKVAAGLPSFADDNLDDSIDLNNYLVDKPVSTFMLRVQGLSMRDAGILPDDILIVDRSEVAKHNKIVIAAVDGELTVKRLYRRGDMLKLLPENPDYPEIPIKDESQLIIWGVVTGSFRKFESTKFS